MKYQAPYGSADPDAPYVDRDTPGAISGSKVPAAAIEHPQRELAALISLTGQAPTAADQTQVARAVQSQRLNYAAAGGSANALTAALAPAPATHAATVGMPVRLLIGSTNSGPATLDVGPGPLPIRTMRGAAIARGDLMAGAIGTFIGAGTAWLLSGIAYSEVPALGGATIWVRADGSDANDGSSNDAAHALATLAEAFNRVGRYAAGGSITIRLGIPATYAPPGVVSLGYRDVTILGDIANQANYIISGSLDRLLSVANGGLTLSGVRINNTSGASFGVSAVAGGALALQYTSITGSAFASHLVLAEGGPVVMQDGCILAASGAVAIGASNASQLLFLSNLTVQGTPAYSLGFAVASGGGQVQRGISNPVITGAATGPRYNAGVLSYINSNGGGINFFPGNAAGVISPSYGVYG